MTKWSELEQELGRWHAAQIRPTFLWRDDDAHDATPELEPLLTLSRTHEVPVHLAVIPAKLQQGLADRLRRCSHVLTMQHGYAHVNHEPLGSGASEFGDTRGMDAQTEDLRHGWNVLRGAGLPHLCHAFVPPWNRMSEATLARMPGLGYRVVSAYEGHTPSARVPGLIRANGHIDPIRWKKGHIFRGAEAMLDLITAHLVARREGRADIAEPIGYLTHHLQTGNDIWDFTDALFARLARQGDARWIRLPALYDPKKAADD